MKYPEQILSVQRILAETGGIQPPQGHRSGLSLTLAERGEISRALAAGDSIQSIAMRLSRAPSAICLAHGTLLRLPVPLWIVAVLAIAVRLALARSVFGRQGAALGAQPGVARYSGLPVATVTAVTFIASALIYGVVGRLLSSTVKAYVPQAGNGYLLNAIGATFIGTTLSPTRRPGVTGTLLGVLLISLVANGLLLIGWNFYWQQVATGVLIFAVLAVSFVQKQGRTA